MRHFEIEKEKKRERNNNSLSHTQYTYKLLKENQNNSFIHRNQFALIVEERSEKF